MPDNNEITLATTSDADIHAFDGSVLMIAMKVQHNDWIKTTDGRYIRTSSIVSLWNPSMFELKEYSRKSIEDDQGVL